MAQRSRSGRKRHPSDSAATMRSVGEFGFLSRLLPRIAASSSAIEVGVGDDCAVVASPAGPLILTTDALVEDIHFRRGWLSSRQLGRRAFLVNASDIAAMGGEPLWALVSLGAPEATREGELLQLMGGIARAAEEVGAAVVGGNVSGSAKLFVSVTLIGSTAHAPITRDGAKAGDVVFVSGTLGGAARAVRSLLAGRKPSARSAIYRAFAEPPARIALGPALAATRSVTAMIDVSDGFVQDLMHILDASGVGASIDVTRLPTTGGSSVPLRERLVDGLSGGEDYELLFCVRPRSVERIRSLGKKYGVRLTEVGRLTAEPGLRAGDPRYQGYLDAACGHDHFRKHAKLSAAPRRADRT